jgi:hypothetical protein
MIVVGESGTEIKFKSGWRNKRYKGFYTIKDVYKYYKGELYHNLSCNKFNKVLDLFHEKIMEQIIKNAYRYYITNFVGYIEIVKRRLPANVKYRRICFNESRKAGKPVYYKNEKQLGYYYKFHWSAKRIRNGKVYKFKATTANRMKLHKRIIENKMIF